VRAAVLNEGYFVESTSVGKDKNYITFSNSACNWQSWTVTVSYDGAGKTLPDPLGLPDYSPITGFTCESPRIFQKLKAELGSTKAQFFLACLYTDGMAMQTGVHCEVAEPDMAEALKWWRRLAGGGDEKSQLFLGDIYSNLDGMNRSYAAKYAKGKGNGVKQDYAEAYFWYGLAVASGDKDVIPLRDNVGKHLNADQKAAEDMRIQDSKTDTSKQQ
jgi:TPR repeat protein